MYINVTAKVFFHGHHVGVFRRPRRARTVTDLVVLCRSLDSQENVHMCRRHIFFFY